MNLLIPYIAIIIIMAAASIIGNNSIYSNPAVIAIWAILAISAIIVFIKKKLIKRPAVFALHAALILILIGALVTHICGESATLHLRINESTNILLNNNKQANSMPFYVSLTNFQVVNYPGTQEPMDYISTLQFSDGTTQKVSMNNIAKHNGYRFYQAAYDDDRRGSTIAVTHDPLGIAITYTAYALLFISMLLLLILPREGFRQAIKRLTIIAILFAPATASAQAPSKVLPDSVANRICNLHVYYNGRICPLQTAAKDFTVKMYGKPSFEHLSAEQVFTAWIFYPASWTSTPMFKVKGNIPAQLNANSKYLTYDQLLTLEQNIKARSTKPTANEQAAIEKLNIIRMLLGGQMLKIFPYNTNNELIWFSSFDNLPLDMPDQQWMFIKKGVDHLAELIFKKDYKQLYYTLDKIEKYQQKTANNLLPSKQLFAAEKIYNKQNAIRPIAMALATIGILAFIFFLTAWTRNNTNSPLVHRVQTSLCILLATLTAYLLFLITLRGFVSGHLPITNGYETMQFMALCVAIITLALHRRFILLLPLGILLVGLVLIVSMFGESNPQITNLMPVLSSPLLSLHVSTMMIAYSLLAFTMFIGITAIIIRNDNTKIQALYNVSHMLLYPAIFLLAAGIFIGAIWANQSWGRYWGWDPKEVWALITLMIYAIPLHNHSLTPLQKPLTFHIYISIAFLSVLMTYFGVNFILGGLHSYA